MAADRALSSRDVIKTYRYLRLGMIGAVVLLGAAIAVERSKVACWQTSISAYYYTPVRAIFVGSMLAVGLALIVIKGRTPLEDICLNMAGMLAPVVAAAPTIDVGKCWSIPPKPLPLRKNGSLADWVVKNVENNIDALLIAGAIGLLAAVLIVMVVNRSVRAPIENVELGTSVTLLVAAALMVAVYLLFEHWDEFNTRAHGFAALIMFAFLAGAVCAKAVEHRPNGDQRYRWGYAVIAIAMVVGAAAIWVLDIGGNHQVLWLEGTEIVLFAIFWLVQTAENWDEAVTSP